METQIIVVIGCSKGVMNGSEVDAGNQCSSRFVAVPEQSVEIHVEHGSIVLETRRKRARWKRAPRFSTWLLTQSAELPVQFHPAE
jgi:hypothetical protein